MKKNKNQEKNSKQSLVITTIILWSVFMLLTIAIANNIFKGTIYTIITFVYGLNSILCLIFAIKLLIVILKSNKRQRKTPTKPLTTNPIIDENILTGRKIYKKTLRKSFGSLFIVTSILSIGSAILLAFLMIDEAGIMLTILLASFIVIVFELTMFIVYRINKSICFLYLETTFNGESFVLFTSKSTLSNWSFSERKFHVVYKSKEYTDFAHLYWLGDNNKSIYANSKNVLRSHPVEMLLTWICDCPVANYLRIDINTEKSGNVQCVFRYETKNFIITDYLDKLEGCFETSLSMHKEQKKNNKEK